MVTLQRLHLRYVSLSERRCADNAVDDHFFFFFQAEDGIRDLTVTGVQTCALPISLALPWREERVAARGNGGRRNDEARQDVPQAELNELPQGGDLPGR